jgi:hypothetical protein
MTDSNYKHAEAIAFSNIHAYVYLLQKWENRDTQMGNFRIECFDILVKGIFI